MQRRAEAEGEASCRAATTQMVPVSPFLPHSAMWIFAGSVNRSFFRHQMPALGERVYVQHLQCAGAVRFAGEIPGVQGEWYGVELDEAKGTSNGKLVGKQLFSCEEKHGVFLRGTNLTSEEEMKKKAAQAALPAQSTNVQGPKSTSMAPQVHTVQKGSHRVQRNSLGFPGPVQVCIQDASRAVVHVCTGVVRNAPCALDVCPTVILRTMGFAGATFVPMGCRY